MSGITWDQMATMYPSLTLNCSTSPEHSPWFDVNKNLDNVDGGPGTTCVFRDATKKRKYDTDQCASVPGLTHRVTCKERLNYSWLNLSIDKDDNTGSITESTHLSNVSKKTSLCSQSDMPNIRSMGDEMLPVKNSKDPQYEDISDAEDSLELANKVPNLELQNEPDDIWEIIPISILNLTFEEAEDGSKQNSGPQDDGKSGDKARHSGTELSEPTYNLVPASAFLPVEVFDTPVQQEQAVVVPSSCIDHEDKLHSLENKYEFGCDTDDSCDYSPDPEGNFLTVSKHFY